MARSFKLSRFSLLGFLSLLCSFIVLWKLLKIYKFLTRMNTINKIKQLLQNNGIGEEMAKIVACQGAHETNNYTSFLYIFNNNCFGMKQPVKRKTLSSGALNGYAHYKNIETSVKDLILWLDFAGMSKNYYSITGYVEALKEKKYFEDTTEHYKKGVEYFYKKYFA